MNQIWPMGIEIWFKTDIKWWRTDDAETMEIIIGSLCDITWPSCQGQDKHVHLHKDTQSSQSFYCLFVQCRGVGDASYHISRPQALWFQTRRFFHVFPNISLCVTCNPWDGAFLETGEFWKCCCCFWCCCCCLQMFGDTLRFSLIAAWLSNIQQEFAYP